MADNANTNKSRTTTDRCAARPLLRPEKSADGRIVITQEMRDMARALTHPEGDPYLNGRDLGFYCEQCG